MGDLIPAGGTRSRRWVILAGTVGMACVAVAVMVYVRVGDRATRPPETHCIAVPAAPTIAISPRSTAPDGGGIRVVESGFTRIGEGLTVSLGAIIENTSSWIAYQTQVTFGISDASGQPAAYPAAGGPPRLTIPVVLPGQRLGVGTGVVVRTSEPFFIPVTVTEFDLGVGLSQWLQLPGSAHALAAIIGEQITAEPEENDKETATVHYTMTSPYCAPIPYRFTAIVFRDGDGKVIGGDFQPNDTHMWRQCLPGSETRQTYALHTVPRTLVAGWTEAYPHCDPFSGP